MDDNKSENRNENSLPQDTVIVKIDPTTVNQKTSMKPKINKVYVVPNNASKKSIIKKLNDPTAEIINAASLLEEKPVFQTKSSKIIKIPFVRDARKSASDSVHEKLLSGDRKDSEKGLEEQTIQISSSTPDNQFEALDEISTEIRHEIYDPDKSKSFSFKEDSLVLNEEENFKSNPDNSLTGLQSMQCTASINGMNLKRNKDSERQIQLAIEDVLKSNMSVKRAAHVYGIRYSLLVSKITKAGSTGKGALGADPALTEKEELSLVNWIKSRYKNGCPVKKIDLINRVSDIVSDGRPTRFKDGTPGEKWFMNFMSRNPSVSSLGPTTRCDSREVPSRQSLSSWFRRCEDHLIAFGQEHLVQDPRRVGSVEELTLCLLSSKTKVSNSNGSRDNTLYFPQEKSGNITVLLGACADGTLTPPMPVFSCRKPPPALINSIPSGWGIGLSKDGNINKEVLQSYFKNILIPWLTEQDRLPFLLFIDKLKAFLSVDTADFCSQKGLLIYNFYPNSALVMQPLYKPVLEPVKKSWGALSTHKNDKEALLQFCPTLNQILYDLAPPYTIVDNFRSCGIYPFDPKAPDYNKCVLISGDKQKNFSSNDYAIGLEVFEDLIGKVKTEIFQETLKGFKLLKSEDGPLFKIWHRLVSKVDVTMSSSDPEEYKHERIIRGACRKLPRPEMYLMVEDEDDHMQEGSMQDFRTFNDLTHTSGREIDKSEDVDDPNPEPVLEIDNTESIINVFPKTEPHSDEEGHGTCENSSAFWKDHYSPEDKDSAKERERIKEERRLERKIKRERKREMVEQDDDVSKRLKKVIGPRFCTQCLSSKGKLIKCMVCKNYIHFECMMEEEQQIMSDLYEDNLAFDYICPNCSH